MYVLSIGNFIIVIEDTSPLEIQHFYYALFIDYDIMFAGSNCLMVYHLIRVSVMATEDAIGNVISD